ncbi:MAG: hypothetical protein R2826_03125 [Thermoleophilia bacterium]
MSGAAEDRRERGAPPSYEDIVVATRAALAADTEAWLVGGCVRDEFLGRAVKDVDLVVSRDGENLARALADRLGGGVYSSSGTFGTWRVVASGKHVDIAPLEPHADADSRSPASGSALTIERRLSANLQARDFTINAVARNLRDGELVDPMNGAEDLRRRRLRLCTPGACKSDPLRVLRLARLARDLDFAVAPEALAAARRAAALLATVSGERVRDELSAMLTMRANAAALRDLASWGALAVLLPELDALRGVEQNRYHHLDVFEHSLEALTYVRDVVDQFDGQSHLCSPAALGMPDVDELVPISWAVVLHDIGKPAARTVLDDGRVVFWHHDRIGGDMATVLARRLRMSARFGDYLATLIREHLRLGFLVREQPLSRRALARYRRNVTPWVFDSVVLSLCDRLATRGEQTSRTAIARHYRLARMLWTSVTKTPLPRLLSGEEVMALLGLSPGPDVGAAMAALEEEVDVGDVTTPEAARVFLLAWWCERRVNEGGEDAPVRRDDAGAS